MSEKLEGFRYDGRKLIIDVTGGGVAECIPRGLSAEIVAARLRHLAIRLDQSVEARAAQETPVVSNGGIRLTCENCGHEPCAEWCKSKETGRDELNMYDCSHCSRKFATVEVRGLHEETCEGQG